MKRSRNPDRWVVLRADLSNLPSRRVHFVMDTKVEAVAAKAIPILKRYGVTRAGVFGSYARGEQRPSSDLDLLVDLPDGSSLFDLVGLQLDIGDELGVEVDAHTYRSLNPLLRDRILAEEIRLL